MSKEEEKKENNNKQNIDNQQKSVIDEVKNSINDDEKKINDELKYWKNSYLEKLADIDNLRKKLQEEHNNMMKYRIESFLTEILSVLDNFYFALNNQSKNNEMKKFLFGFECIYKELLRILKNEGVEEIIPKIGDIFNENNMSAIETVYCDDKKPNTVLKINLKGYKLKDHLIRPAIVVVSTNEKNTSSKKEEK